MNAREATGAARPATRGAPAPATPRRDPAAPAPRTSRRAPAATPAPAAEAWRLLQQLFRGQRGRLVGIAGDFGLAPGQAMALCSLDPGAPVPMSELAESLDCDNSNVTGIIDRLEDRGLVERRPVVHDRRVKMLVVTAQGAATRERLLSRLSEPPPVLSSLSAADQRVLRDVLRRALARR